MHNVLSESVFGIAGGLFAQNRLPTKLFKQILSQGLVVREIDVRIVVFTFAKRHGDALITRSTIFNGKS